MLQTSRRVVLVLALVPLLASCASREGGVPAGTLNPDRYLMDQAEAAAADGDELEAREYFQQVVDNYPQSPFRADARMGLANSYLEQGSTESLVLAAAEFQDFLRFYPTNPRVDEAQFGLAMTHFEQMRAPERDQTETRAALAEFQTLFDSYPQSPIHRGGTRALARGPRPAEPVLLRSGILLLPPELVPWGDLQVRGNPRRRPRIHGP